MIYWRVCRQIAAEFREIMEPRWKVPTWGFLLSLTQDQLDLFIETAISGDGSRVLDRVGRARVLTRGLALQATGSRTPRPCLLAVRNVHCLRLAKGQGAELSTPTRLEVSFGENPGCQLNEIVLVCGPLRQ